jgi:hypothetical protein
MIKNDGYRLTLDRYLQFQNLFAGLVAEPRSGGLGYGVTGQALRQYPFPWLKHTCVNVIQVDDKGNGKVERYNDPGHLEAGMCSVQGADVVA